MMSEYINRDDALNCFHDWFDEHGDVVCADDTAKYIQIESLQSIEVVRCKDCEYWSGEVHDGIYYFQWCSLTGQDMMYDDFCSNAVQKDGDAE